MKLRIKDSSIRFRITLKELEELRAAGRLAKETVVPAGEDASLVFRYALEVDRTGKETVLDLQPYAMTVRLSAADFEALARDDEEGIYIRREWQDAGTGQARRFMAFVEKDRPGSTCEKPEEWIYEEVLGQRPRTVPIPAR